MTITNGLLLFVIVCIGIIVFVLGIRIDKLQSELYETHDWIERQATVLKELTESIKSVKNVDELLDLLDGK